MKRASIHTLGCRLNQAESALLEERLAAAGYALVPFGEPADLGIVHTCTVTGEADAKSRKLVRQFIRKNPDAYTAVIGCYAQTGAAALANIPGIDLIIGNQEKLNVLDYVASGKNPVPVVVRDHIERNDFTIEAADCPLPLDRRANLKVQDGCDFMCGFCVIPFARGRARSRELDNLVEEAEHLVARGAREIVLTGVNIGTYAWHEHNVVDIVDRLNALRGLRRIRISSIEATTVPDGLLERMADPAHALVPYLHIPMQSGADPVLAAMRRRHTRAAFLEFLDDAQRRVPGIGIGTDALVGYPGETEEDFEETLSAFEQSPCFYAHVFKYSERPGTVASRTDGKVPPQIIDRRAARLRRMSALKEHAFHKAHIGVTAEVLFEEQDGHGCWSGYTGNYLRVAAPSTEALKNTFRFVHITEVQGIVAFGEIVPGAEESGNGAR